jgi:hypothetical protein
VCKLRAADVRASTALLVIIGALHFWLGVAVLEPVLHSFVYEPRPFEESGLAFSAVPVMNAGVSLTIAYAFFRRRRWGRYVATTFNGTCATTWLVWFAIAQRTERPDVSLSVVLFLGVLALPVGIMVLCLHPSVRRAMDR